MTSIPYPSAYAGSQEVQSDLALMEARGVQIAGVVSEQASRLGGLIYGSLRAELRGSGR